VSVSIAIRAIVAQHFREAAFLHARRGALTFRAGSYADRSCKV
jgi:hypothetical protein